MTGPALRGNTRPALSGWSEHEIGTVGQPASAGAREES
jgi:hypothetical protein